MDPDEAGLLDAAVNRGAAPSTRLVGERRIRHDVHDVAGVWCFHYEAMADEHGHVSGEASVPAEPGVGTRSPGVSRDSVVAVPSRICVDVVRLRWWPPAAHAATIRLEQSHAAGPFAPKMSGFPRSPHANVTAASAAGDVPARTI